MQDKMIYGNICPDLFMSIVEYVPLACLKKLSAISPIFDEIICKLGIKVVSYEDDVYDLDINKHTCSDVFMANYGVERHGHADFKVTGRMIVRFDSGLLMVLDTRSKENCDERYRHYYSGFCPSLLVENYVCDSTIISYNVVENADNKLSCEWGRTVDRKNKRAIYGGCYKIIEYKDEPDQSIKSDGTIIRGMPFMPMYISINNKLCIKIADNGYVVYFDHFKIIYANGEWIR